MAQAVDFQQNQRGSHHVKNFVVNAFFKFRVNLWIRAIWSVQFTCLCSSPVSLFMQ